MDDRDPITDRDTGFLSSPPYPDHLWAHSASYPMGTAGSFPGGKAAGQ
jgi:hypothetical protein